MNAYQAPVDIPSSKHSSKCDQHTTLCHILLYPEQFPSNSLYENKLATIYRENVSSLYRRFRRSTRRRRYTGKRISLSSDQKLSVKIDHTFYA